jgi:hypothetical protein
VGGRWPCMPSAGYRMLPACVLGKDTRGSTDGGPTGSATGDTVGA